MQHGYQCGMIWGAALAAGAQAYHRYGPGSQAEAKAIIAAKKIVESFRALNNNINCLEITNIGKSSSTMQMIKFFLIKGGPIGCFRMAARYAPVAFNEINIALSEKHNETPNQPVSCAAMLAEKMGVSEMHQVMASGYAGGIGLCGGACGALGTAIWILGMKGAKEKDGKVDFKNPKAQEIIDRFLKHTDFKFDCSQITGRKFESVNDHADFLHNGGCADLIDILAGN